MLFGKSCRIEEAPLNRGAFFISRCPEAAWVYSSSLRLCGSTPHTGTIYEWRCVMNYGQMRDFILQLINRYSVAGAKYQPSYNNQQDYLNKIPMLINDGLVYVASGIRKMPAQHILSYAAGEDYGDGYRRHILPEDCLEVCSGGLMVPNPRPGEQRWLKEYILQEPDFILIPKWMNRDVVLEYYRRPQLLPPAPTEDARVDALLDVQNALCYYVAAHLVIHDDNYLYTILYNEFENRAARMVQAPTTEIRGVTDVYGFEGMGDCYG